MQNISPYLSIVAISISCFALIIAFFNYRRKSNIKLYGDFQLTSSRSCEDDYISKIILENKKDRSVTIFGIYLKIYPNYYIELSNHDDNPIIIKPFESYNEEFGPIQYYGINMNRIKINHLFDRKGKKLKYKIRIVLSTSDGKYTIKKSIKHWIPIGECFKNYFTGWIIPYTLKYKDKFVGSNVKFIILFKYENSEQTIHLHERDYELKLFQNFNFTKESLESKENLVKFINDMKIKGLILCKSFEVIETSEWKSQEHKIITAKIINSFQYHILGKILTYLSNKKMKKENKKLTKLYKNQTKENKTLKHKDK